jgi:serine/threonine protein kinase
MALPKGWAAAPGGQHIESGQAHVFEVVRDGDSRRFALKRLKNPARSERFAREVAAMKQLEAAGIRIVPPVLDHGADDARRPYYVMPWFESGSLDIAVARRRFVGHALSGVETLIDLANALSVLHEAGWAHRDLKPANVLLDDDGTLLLADLGLALEVVEGATRLTGVDEAVGSRLYIAPEHESGILAGPDHRPADFYSFGKIAWAVLVGKQPPARERQLEGNLRLASILGDARFAVLNDLCGQLLRTNPRARLAEWPPVVAELTTLHNRLTGTTAHTETERPRLDVAVDAARRFQQSQYALESGQDKARAQLRHQQFLELRAALWGGLQSFGEAWASLDAQAGAEIHVGGGHGGLQLSDLISFGVLDGAESLPPGLPDLLPASLADMAGAWMIGPYQLDSPFPSLYVCGFVVVHGDSVWTLRVPVVLTRPGLIRHLVPSLLARFGSITGPARLGLSAAHDNARRVGEEIGQIGVLLTAEYFEHLSHGESLDASDTWRAPRATTHSAQ